jgi:hypothetical protein
MKPRLVPHNAFKAVVLQVIRDPDIPIPLIAGAFRRLPEPDRDAMPYVPRLLAREQGAPIRRSSPVAPRI